MHRVRIVATCAALVALLGVGAAGASAAGCSSFSSDDGPEGDGGASEETSTPEAGPADGIAPPSDAGAALRPLYARAFGSATDAGASGPLMLAPSMVVEPSGGVSLLGSYAGGVVDLGGGGRLSATAGTDVYLARFDGNGSYLSARSFGDDKTQYGASLAGTADKLYAAVVVEGTTEFATDVFVTSEGVAGRFNSATARFDGTLSATGLRTFKGADNVLVKHVAIGTSGSVVSFGDWRSAVSINGGSSNTRSGTGPGLVFTRSFALSGADIVHTDYCPDGVSLCTASALGTNSATGEILAGGRFSGTLTDGDAGAVTAVAGSDDGFLMKLDPALERRWVLSVRGSSTQEVLAIAAVPQSNDFVVAGVFDGTLEVPGSPEVLTKGVSDVFVLRVDAAGAIVWVKTLGGAGADRVRAIAADAAGNVFVTGSFAGPSFETGGVALTNADKAGRGTTDVFLAWLDAKGAPVHAARYGGGDDDVGSAIGVAGNGDVVVAGSFEGTIDFGSGPLTARGRADTFLVKLAR